MQTRLRNDIQKREQLVEELRLQSEIIANLAEGVYLGRADDGVIVFTNPAFEKMFGYGSGEMIGKHVSILNAPSDKHPEETAKEIRGILDKTGSWQGEINNIKKDGTPFWCYAHVSMFDHPVYGKVWVTAHIDITERKQAAAVLRESEERFRDLYENAPNAYLSIGVDGRIHRCNRRAGELLGFAVKELVAQQVLELYADTPHGKEEAAKVLERFRAGETVHDEELQMQKADGTPVWISLTMSAVRDSQRRIVESRSMVVDITGRKQAEEEIRKLNEDLEKRVLERTAELQKTINLMAGREVRMAELKKVIQKLREQVESAGMTPIGNDP
ncbi:MAG TPA: PAS domain S-box protein [Desulfobacterales bacterium]|nr:PAS domain S-box protein [Desulfobacterales bacterium]